VGTIVAGLGGRAILKGSLREAFGLAICDELEEPYFLDMNWDLIRGEIDRAGQTRRSGPTAEHVLKALRENAATREIPLVPVAR
jgi:pyruvate ferredoxin oxidoreductase alpha subunit